MSKSYLKKFFAEKDLPEVTWQIEAADGNVHMIDSEFVKELIFKHASVEEVKGIANTIRKIDFVNGDVNHYLKHLATGYINTVGV